MSEYRRSIYLNPTAKSWNSAPSTVGLDDRIVKFHQSLPYFEPTRLVSLDEAAREVGIKALYVKDESNRLGLPSFKILGASWATFRAIAQKLDLPLSTGLKDLAAAAKANAVTLYAATDGNHGRAVARMGSLLGIDTRIYVPKFLDLPTKNFIAGEGAMVEVVEGDYDVTVKESARAASGDAMGILIQDTAWEGYTEIPQWIVEGYTTMMHEIDEQIQGTAADVVFVPVGVGAFAQSVVTHYKSPGRATQVVAIEPDTAACLRKSLAAGKPLSISTHKTIMSGMNCGTVSSIAWPILKSGVDASITVSDFEAHNSVQYLQSKGILAGPCSGAALAALRYIADTNPEALDLNSESVVVLLCTEGPRDYITPLDVSIDDPIPLT